MHLGQNMSSLCFETEHALPFSIIFCFGQRIANDVREHVALDLLQDRLLANDVRRQIALDILQDRPLSHAFEKP